jgi:hypothetical protein
MTLAGMCAPCAPGTYCSVLLANESETQCVSCPENHYCPEGSIYPVSCPPGEVSEASSHLLQQCQCPPDFGRYSQQNCTLCPHYFFSLTSSNSEYTQCPENKTTLYTGIKNQSDCVYIPGHGILDYLSSSPCILCQDTSFQQGFKNESCTSCDWGALSLTGIESESCQCNRQLGLFNK